MTFDWGKIREGWKVRGRRGGGKRWGEGNRSGEGERGRGGGGGGGGEGEAIIVDDLCIKKQSATIKVLDLTRLQVIASERKPCRIQYLATISEASKKHYTKQVNAAAS